MGFTRRQVDQLLRPIYPKRVLRDGKGHSHVSQQDVLAHLIRVFGFGNFDIEVVETACVFEEQHVDKKTGEVSIDRWNCCYRAMVRLIVRDPDGNEVAHYENGSTATAQNQTRGDAHDLAYKSAISLSVKRAAIALGDNFGLSLYNKGQTDALVMATLVQPDGDGHDGDLQDGVSQQVALGNDETEPDDQPGPSKWPTRTTREMDEAYAAEHGVTVEEARRHRLDAQKVARDTLGTKSNGEYRDPKQKATRTKPSEPEEFDPWADGPVLGGEQWTLPPEGHRG